MSKIKRKYVTFGKQEQDSFDKVFDELPEKYKNGKGFIEFVKDGFYKHIQEYIKR